MSDVLTFPKRKRPDQPDGQSLVPVHTRECSHWGVSFLVDETKSTVECGGCHAQLNPIWVLHQLATRESNYVRNRQACIDEQKRMDKRSRTECQHCGKQTKISKN